MKTKRCAKCYNQFPITELSDAPGICRKCLEKHPDAFCKMLGKQPSFGHKVFRNLTVKINDEGGEQMYKEVEDRTTALLKLPKRVARILKDTVLFQGEDATVQDDEALMKIRDLVEEIDENIFKSKPKRRKAFVGDQTNESQD
jgi:hypothetical protein